MSTNYFLYESPACPTCGHQKEPLHIGKSSFGWCFGLHYLPEEGLFSLEDWVARWSLPGAVIRDEYGDAHTPARMIAIVTQRRSLPRLEKHPYGYKSWDDFYSRNYAVPDGSGLLRHRIMENFCVAHGAGTWDMLPGYFR